MEMETKTMTMDTVRELADNAVGKYLHLLPEGKSLPTTVIGIPRGGLFAAQLVAESFRLKTAVRPKVFTPKEHPVIYDGRARSVVVDDIYDTGKTISPYLGGVHQCMVLLATARTVDKADKEGIIYGAVSLGGWTVFPWETNEAAGPEDAVVRILQYLGLDPSKESLRDTPRRLLSWLSDFKEGQPLGSELTTFTGESYDEMVVVKDIPFVSLCEHHLLPFTGRAAVAYIPATPALSPSLVADSAANAADGSDMGGPILGLSKLARIVQWRAKRATVQERLTKEIMEEVSRAAGTPHVAVVLEAEHSCMTLRGAKAHGSTTLTSAMSGAFRDEGSTRSEFLSFARG